MAKVSKMQIVHIGESVPNEAKEYPNAKVVNIGDLDRITFVNGKMQIETAKAEEHEANKKFILDSIATHSGKMSGIPSISTSVVLNENCKHHAAVKGSICEKCYARNLVKLRKGLADKLERNYHFYATVDLTAEDVPFINSAIFRFESFGNLANVQHFKNYCTIARQNPQTRFTLWTKNHYLIEAYLRSGGDIPQNLYIIASSVYVNKSACEVVEKLNAKNIMTFIDAVFTVYDKQTIKAENIAINCGGRKCIECRRCYNLEHGRRLYQREERRGLQRNRRCDTLCEDQSGVRR